MDRDAILEIVAARGKMHNPETGYAVQEIDANGMRFGGEGLWVAISRDPKTGMLRAASHNRNNSAAVAR